MNVGETLRPLLPPRGRTVILGVGSELRRDDFAGMYAAELLAARADGVRLLVLGGGAAPENFTGPVRDFAPDAVIVLDAARLGKTPGDYAVLDPEQITGLTFSTHMLPLPVMLSYLERACGCATAYVGIEPASTAQGIGLDPRVRAGAERLAEELAAAAGCLPRTAERSENAL